MNPRTTGIFLGIITLACFATGLILYPSFPAIVATHWNSHGAINGYSPKFWGLFLLPLIILGLDLIWYVLPKIEPRAKGFVGFRHVYDFFWILLTAFLAYVYALMLYFTLGFSLDFREALLPALGLFLISIGLLLPHIKQNWFFGIRTPWALQSEDNWDKTQRFGGRLFVAAGALTFLGGFTGDFGLGLMVGSILAAAIASVVQSYLLYRRGA